MRTEGPKYDDVSGRLLALLWQRRDSFTTWLRNLLNRTPVEGLRKLIAVFFFSFTWWINSWTSIFFFLNLIQWLCGNYVRIVFPVFDQNCAEIKTQYFSPTQTPRTPSGKYIKIYTGFYINASMSYTRHTLSLMAHYHRQHFYINMFICSDPIYIRDFFTYRESLCITWRDRATAT